MVLVVRSLVFNILFYVNVTLLCIAALPTLVMPGGAIVAVARTWARSNLLLLRVICGIKTEFTGLENLPPGPLLIASKHQSAWETFALILLVDKPAYIMKRELMWLPLFGWFAWKASMIPIDRDAGGQVIPRLTRRVRKALRDGFQILIFPEGTRRPAGAPPLYKYGIAHLYRTSRATCVPVALNSGLFWPRRSFLRYPGTIRVQVLDPIAPGLSVADFLAVLEREVETATALLVAEGERELIARGIRPVSVPAA